jgi:translation initiation factor 5
MGSVNVNRSVSDQFYRYKMPKLIAKVEGKGNGIKTVIANMVEIGKSLNRPPTYPTKYFGCELGAQTQFDLKNDRFIVNGSHDAQKLQSLLDGFIKKFVLCPECDNPETKLLVNQKKQTINQHCIACGYQGMVDMRHKLTTFIVKYPPVSAPSTGGASLTAVKEKGKSKRKGDKSKKNGDADGSRGDDGSDGDFGSVDKDGSDDFDDDWGEDTSEDAVAKRMEDLSNGAKGMTLNDDMEKTQQERLDIFYEYVKKRKADGKIDGLDKEIVAEAERLDIRDKGLLVLLELLFNEQMLQQIKQHRILFLRFTHGSHKAQKYLLGGFEQLVKLYRDVLISKVPHILKAFYDLDILEEEVVIEWAKKVSKKYVSKELAQEIRDKAAPFIKWLQEAEEEDSEEEDDEQEDKVEIVYSDRDLPPARPIHVEPAAKVIPSGNDEDLDIDAI